MKDFLFKIGKLKFKFPFNEKDGYLKIHYAELKTICDSFNIPLEPEPTTQEDKKE
jgi:hypothetical protein